MLAELAQPPSGAGVYESHVAIDPHDPSRIVVVATHPASGLGLGRDIWCWRTADGGRTWTDGRIDQPQLDGEGAADPLVAFGPDGAMIAVSMTRERAYIDTRLAADQAYTRFTSPTFEERLQAWKGRIGEDAPLPPDMICFTRSEDEGRTWSGCVIPNSGSGDKPALAVDNHRMSPHAGHVYTAWADGRTSSIAFARSTDGGRTAEPARSFGGRNGIPYVQLATTPDGVVHMLWFYALWALPGAEHPQAATGFFYSSSSDGGASFSDPVVVAEHGGAGRVPMVSLAASPAGALLAVWSEVTSPPPDRGYQARQTLRFIHADAETNWSAPAPVTSLPSDVGQGLPAVASSGSSWHILSFDADALRTTVRVYASAHEGLEFEVQHDLATREFGLQDVYLHGSYQVRFAKELVNVGDYVGLAGAGSSLAAAIVLPRDDWPSVLSGYAGRLSV
jgi:hypothetical protein